MNETIKKLFAAVALLIIFLFCLVVALSIHQVMSRKGHISWKYYAGTHRYKAVTTADIAYISPWMTFDYINKIFDLPPRYLEEILQINNSKYPLLTVQKYSKNANRNSTVVTENIRTAIKQFMASSTPQ